MPELDITPFSKAPGKTANRLRHKLFFWLLLHDRVNTRNLLKRKNMFFDSYDCVFCNEHSEETLRHLFWDCNFAQDCWNSNFPSRKPGISCFDDIMLIHALLPAGIALDVIIQGCWRIWTQRNGKIFRKEVPSINCWKYRLKEDRSWRTTWPCLMHGRRCAVVSSGLGDFSSAWLVPTTTTTRSFLTM